MKKKSSVARKEWVKDYTIHSEPEFFIPFRPDVVIRHRGSFANVKSHASIDCKFMCLGYLWKGTHHFRGVGSFGSTSKYVQGTRPTVRLAYEDWRFSGEKNGLGDYKCVNRWYLNSFWVGTAGFVLN